MAELRYIRAYKICSCQLSLQHCCSVNSLLLSVLHTEPTGWHMLQFFTSDSTQLTMVSGVRYTLVSPVVQDVLTESFGGVLQSCDAVQLCVGKPRSSEQQARCRQH